MNAAQATDSLFRYFNARRGYSYQLCNAYVFKWESDFFCIASSGYAYEIEVKVSLSDFRADFNKKEKHRILEAGEDKIKPVKRGTGYVCRQLIKNGKKWDEVVHQPFYNMEARMMRTNKWPLVSYLKWINPALHSPNKFLYACPEGLIPKQEIPDYAGLVYLPEDNRRKPKVIIKPPAIHRKKNDYTKILLKKYYWAYINSLGYKKEAKNFNFPNEE